MIGKQNQKKNNCYRITDLPSGTAEGKAVEKVKLPPPYFKSQKKCETSKVWHSLVSRFILVSC